VVSKSAVTAAEVWAALEEIADPEIPIISLVDLGVIRDVAVDGDRVRIEFTPTFLGCPALEVMRDAIEAKVVSLGGEPEVAVIQDDSWSTDLITPAGREKLREAGFAPPAPRAAAGPRRSCSSSRRHSAVRIATRPRRASRTSSARRRAARSAGARAAASHSSSSRRSDHFAAE